MMGIQVVDEKLVHQIEDIARQVRRTPEQVIAEAMRMYEEQLQTDGVSFWSAVTGLGASGEADVAARDEEILLDEVDPIRGWGCTAR